MIQCLCIMERLGMLRVDPGHTNYLGIYYDPGQTRSIPRKGVPPFWSPIFIEATYPTKTLTISKWFSLTAIDKGKLPPPVHFKRFSPFTMKNFSILMLFFLIAVVSGVMPKPSIKFISAPCLIRHFAASSLSSAIALCRGVHWLSSLELVRFYPKPRNRRFWRKFQRTETGTESKSRNI